MNKNRHMNERAPFNITRGRGWQLFLPNGLGISVQFGPGNYASPRTEGGRWGPYDAPAKVAAEGGLWEADTAEIAIFTREGELMNLGYDTVAGGVKVSDVAALVGMLVGVSADEDESLVRAAAMAILGASEPEDDEDEDEEDRLDPEAAAYLGLLGLE